MLFISRFGVYHWENFEFEDSSKKDKYWIALSCTFEQKEFYAVLPTSKVDKYFNKLDTYIIKNGFSEYFKVDTLLDFNNIQISTKEKIENAYKNSKFKYLGLLEKEHQIKIEETIKNSFTLSQKMIDDLLCQKSSK